MHSDRIESSSFLWNDWNRFQENYHPLYVADGDPKTAWVEGNAGSGAGEWIRVRVTPLEGATKIRLRIRNGYQKSSSLFKANARMRSVQVKLLPGGATRSVELRDAKGWQDVVVEQPAGRLDGVEVHVLSVYEGKKYKDLCVSDMQLFATATTPDNPVFEKAKLAKVVAWKRERAAAAQMFKDASSQVVPLAPQYRVTASESWTAPPARTAALSACQYEPICRLKVLLDTARERGNAHREILDLARKALGNDLARWQPVQVAVKDKRPVPMVDGLYTQDLYWAWEGGTGDGFEMPQGRVLGFLSADQLGVFSVKDERSLEKAMSGDPALCKGDGKVYYWAPPAIEAKGKKAAGPQRTRLVLMVSCGTIEVRDGTDTVAMVQLLGYGQDGKLELVAGGDYAALYQWRDGEPTPVISRGERIASSYGGEMALFTLAEASPFERR